ncbi:MAG TPA: YXWGXW repeat-containing protein [Polyangiaceae bacterium]|nr:YXWGXW repeat-containing protein [Polyangiaceae bacterium]
MSELRAPKNNLSSGSELGFGIVTRYARPSATFRRGIQFVLSCCCSLSSVGCGSSLPTPPSTQHPRGAFTAVPYPPPAALAETLVPRPERADVVWIDGGWIFRGRSYAWQRGGWVVPPEGGRFALSKVVFARDGRILYAPSAWYDQEGTQLDRIRPFAPAATPPNEYTAETQTSR